MRDIRFRGKRKDNGEWVYGGLYQDQAGAAFIIDAHRSSHSWNKDGTALIMVEAIPVVPETVGQFTGLCDRSPDKKECCKGDIVKVRFRKHNGKFYYENGVVEWCKEKGDWLWVATLGDEMLCQVLSENYIYQGEIIGNIHEHAELLEKAK